MRGARAADDLLHRSKACSCYSPCGFCSPRAVNLPRWLDDEGRSDEGFKLIGKYSFLGSFSAMAAVSRAGASVSLAWPHLRRRRVRGDISWPKRDQLTSLEGKPSHRRAISTEHTEQVFAGLDRHLPSLPAAAHASNRYGWGSM